MILDGYHGDVMSSKTWACRIFFLGFVLNLGVAEVSWFDNYITNKLLNDHWFLIQDFQQPGEPVEVGYTRLSIVDMLCTSLNKYGDKYESNKKMKDKDSRELVIWTYKYIVVKYLNLTNQDDTLTACKKHHCNFSFSQSYISPVQLKEKYYSAYNWTGSLPACPSPQTTSPSPSLSSQVNHAASTPTPTYSSTSHSFNTTHQPSTRTASSLSQSGNTTSPSPSRCNNETIKAEKLINDSLEQMKNQNHFLVLFLILSVTVNFALIITVCCQRKNKKLQVYNEEYQHYHNVELVHLRIGEQTNTEVYQQDPIAECTKLNGDQTKPEANGPTV